MTHVIDGKEIASRIESGLKERLRSLAAPPSAAVFYSSSIPEVISYVKSKAKRAERLGISLHLLDMASMDREIFLETLSRVSSSPEYDAVMVERPLPFQVEEEAIFSRIPREKDADGLHPGNLGRLFAGKPCVVPATPAAVLRILDESGIEIRGKEAVVIGRSLVVGRPLALLFLHRDATVTLCHTKTANLAHHCIRADILVAAAGKAGLVTGEMVKPGAVVVDVGTNYVQGQLVGDVDFPSVSPLTSFISPVPGGVGPVTSILILENIVALAERLHTPIETP